MHTRRWNYATDDDTKRTSYRVRRWIRINAAYCTTVASLVGLLAFLAILLVHGVSRLETAHNAARGLRQSTAVMIMRPGEVVKQLKSEWNNRYKEGKPTGSPDVDELREDIDSYCHHKYHDIETNAEHLYSLTREDKHDMIEVDEHLRQESAKLGELSTSLQAAMVEEGKLQARLDRMLKIKEQLASQDSDHGVGGHSML